MTGSPVTYDFDMPIKTLSIFVDESGRFQYPDADSRFYIEAIGSNWESGRLARADGRCENLLVRRQDGGYPSQSGPLSQGVSWGNPGTVPGWFLRRWHLGCKARRKI